MSPGPGVVAHGGRAGLGHASMRATFLALSVLALCSCNVVDTRLPDGGRARYNCTNSPNTFPVQVLDKAGAPAVGASVKVVNASDGRYDTLTTDDRGVAKVSEDMGPGTVNITADVGGYTTTPGVFTFTCGECDCACSPRELILQVQ